MKALIVAVAVMWASLAGAEPLQYTSTGNGIRVVLPDSLQDDAVALLAWVDLRGDEFRAQCYKWQQAARCETALLKPVVTVLDDFVLFCGKAVSASSLCGGVSWKSRITVPAWGKINAVTLEECASSDIVRDRQDMYDLSHGNEYWLGHWTSYFCNNTQVVLPALVHELCHYFGKKVGHVAGREECQSR